MPSTDLLEHLRARSAAMSRAAAATMGFISLEKAPRTFTGDPVMDAELRALLELEGKIRRRWSQKGRQLAPVHTVANQTAKPGKRTSASLGPSYHLPATRGWRPETTDGRRPFHYDHQVIAPVHANKKEALANAVKRGDLPESLLRDLKARVAEHGIYIERAEAVALAEPGVPQPADDHGAYIERDTATPSIEEGGRVLFTNIDDDSAIRADFWHAVTDCERKASPDEMSVVFAGHEDFWNRIARENDVPDLLRQAILVGREKGKARVETGANEPVRAWLYRRCERWTNEGDDSTTHMGIRHGSQVEWHDGRGGRVQQRIVSELPADLTAKGREAVLDKYRQFFEKRKLPYVAVLHAPDYRNNEKNWHLHLIYYDRPARRLANGKWDFEQEHIDSELGIAALPWGKNGRARHQFPYRQPKVREVASDKWLEKLRAHFADVVNAQLELEGRTHRRFDPASRAALGLPGSGTNLHLGPRLNALEKFGVATPAGMTLEQQQAFDIRDSLIREYHAEQDNVDRQRDQRLTSVRYAGLDDAARQRFEADAREAHRLAREAAEAAHISRVAMDTSERLQSRPKKVIETAGRYLEAIEAGVATARDVRREVELRNLTAGARSYIDEIEPITREHARLAADGVARAKDQRAEAAAIGARFWNDLDAARDRNEVIWFAETSRPVPAMSVPAKEVAVHTSSPMASPSVAEVPLASPPAEQAADQVTFNRIMAKIEDEGWEILRKGERCLLNPSDAREVGLIWRLANGPLAQRRLDGMRIKQERGVRRINSYYEKADTATIERHGDDFALAAKVPAELRQIAHHLRRHRGLQRILEDLSAPTPTIDPAISHLLAPEVAKVEPPVSSVPETTFRTRHGLEVQAIMNTTPIPAQKEADGDRRRAVADRLEADRRRREMAALFSTALRTLRVASSDCGRGLAADLQSSLGDLRDRHDALQKHEQEIVTRMRLEASARAHEEAKLLELKQRERELALAHLASLPVGKSTIGIYAAQWKQAIELRPQDFDATGVYGQTVERSAITAVMVTGMDDESLRLFLTGWSPAIAVLRARNAHAEVDGYCDVVLAGVLADPVTVRVRDEALTIRIEKRDRGQTLDTIAAIDARNNVEHRFIELYEDILGARPIDPALRPAERNRIVDLDVAATLLHEGVDLEAVSSALSRLSPNARHLPVVEREKYIADRVDELDHVIRRTIDRRAASQTLMDGRLPDDGGADITIDALPIAREDMDWFSARNIREDAMNAWDVVERLDRPNFSSPGQQLSRPGVNQQVHARANLSLMRPQSGVGGPGIGV